LLFLDSDGDASSGAAGDTNGMQNVIRVDFQRRRRVTIADEYRAAADRCELSAASQDHKTARTLRRLAEQYRQRAADFNI